MKLTATLSPKQFRHFFAGLDKDGLSYYFNLNHIEVDNTLHLLCMVDGADYDGVTIVLRPDGTWTTLIDVNTGAQA